MKRYISTITIILILVIVGLVINDKNNQVKNGIVTNKPQSKAIVVSTYDHRDFKNYAVKEGVLYYAYEHEVVGADLDSFKDISMNGRDQPYAVDKNHVYYQWKIIDLADPKTFVLIPCAWTDEYDPWDNPCSSRLYAKDDKHVFYGETLLPNRDPQTFVDRKRGLTMDKNGLYYNNKKCLNESTDIQSVKQKFGINLPKNWLYESDNSEDSITDCNSSDGFNIVNKINYEDIGVNNSYSKPISEDQLKPLVSFIAGATIKGKFVQMPTEDTGRYVYEVDFPKSNQKFIIISSHGLQNYPLLASLRPLN